MPDRWKAPEDMTTEELRYVLNRGEFRSFYDSLRARSCSLSMTVTAWGTMLCLAYLLLSLVT